MVMMQHHVRPKLRILWVSNYLALLDDTVVFFFVLLGISYCRINDGLIEVLDWISRVFHILYFCFNSIA